MTKVKYSAEARPIGKGWKSRKTVTATAAENLAFRNGPGLYTIWRHEWREGGWWSGSVWASLTVPEPH